MIYPSAVWQTDGRAIAVISALSMLSRVKNDIDYVMLCKVTLYDENLALQWTEMFFSSSELALTAELTSWSTQIARGSVIHGGSRLAHIWRLETTIHYWSATTSHRAEVTVFWRLVGGSIPNTLKCHQFVYLDAPLNTRRTLPGWHTINNHHLSWFSFTRTIDRINTVKELLGVKFGLYRYLTLNSWPVGLR